jgi:hypothetical protein
METTYKRKTRPSMQVLRDIEERSCNFCCSGKAMFIAYSECVFVALGIQHARCMRHTIICGLADSTTYFRLISGRILETKLLDSKRVF